MRLYQSAWNKLKSNPETPLVISAHPTYHRRIYKAIIKEKNIDTVFHLLLDNEGKSSRLKHKSEGNMLTITMEIFVTINGIF